MTAARDPVEVILEALRDVAASGHPEARSTATLAIPAVEVLVRRLADAERDRSRAVRHLDDERSARVGAMSDSASMADERDAAETRVAALEAAWDEADAERTALGVEVARLKARTPVDLPLGEWREWSRDTFPSQTAQSNLHHLRRELVELEPHLGSPATEQACAEAVDVLALAYGLACIVAGERLPCAMRAKLAANKRRAWGPPDADGVQEHTRDGDRCPTCASPAAHLHPAVQHGGEVQPCRDAFHGGTGAVLAAGEGGG